MSSQMSERYYLQHNEKELEVADAQEGGLGGNQNTS